MHRTFEELIGSDLDDLHSAALCFTQDRHRAEELLQEAAIRAFHEFRSGVSPADFRRWMLGILVTTYLLKERRRGVDPLAVEVGPESEEQPDRGQDVAVPFPEPGTRAHEWLRAWLNEAWPELDAGDRLVLWLAAVERIRHPRVATMLGLAEEQVRRRHYRARRSLSTGASRLLARDRCLGSAEA